MALPKPITKDLVDDDGLPGITIPDAVIITNTTELLLAIIALAVTKDPRLSRLLDSKIMEALGVGT